MIKQSKYVFNYKLIFNNKFLITFNSVSGLDIEGHWVLGMIENGSEDLRLEICPDNDRSSEVLTSLITKHVNTQFTLICGVLIVI